MSRLNAYSKPTADGEGLNVDIEGMLVDMVMILKASGCQRKEFIKMVEEVWAELIVEVKIPKNHLQ